MTLLKFLTFSPNGIIFPRLYAIFLGQSQIHPKQIKGEKIQPPLGAGVVLCFADLLTVPADHSDSSAIGIPSTLGSFASTLPAFWNAFFLFLSFLLTKKKKQRGDEEFQV